MIWQTLAWIALGAVGIFLLVMVLTIFTANGVCEAEDREQEEYFRELGKKKK